MKKSLLTILSLCFFAQVFAAAPTNDNCAGATTLQVSSTEIITSGTLAGATASGTTVCDGSNPDDDVWYKFTPATNASITVTVKGPGSFDAGMAIQNNCGSYTMRLCMDALGNGSPETITFAPIANTTYYLRIYDANAGVPSSPTFSISMSAVAAPANDECTTATNLIFGANTINGTIFNSTASGQTACSPNVADHDVWYKFTPATAAVTVISVIGDANFDPVLQIASNCGASLTLVTCQDKTDVGGTETYSFSQVGGTTYYARIYNSLSNAVSAASTFRISVSSLSTGVEDAVITENTISLLPNPSSGAFKISGLNHEMAEVNIYDAIGQLVYSNTAYTDTQIELPQASNGVYSVHVKTAANISSSKLLINK